MKKLLEQCRSRWMGRAPYVLLMLSVAITCMAGQSGREKTSKRATEKQKLTASGPSGSDQVLTAVYDPTTSSLRVEGSGSGSSISVGLSMPNEFSVTGSPVTSTGVLTVNWAQPVSVAHGGTGQTTAAAAFNALAPATAAGGLIYGIGTNSYGNLSLGAAGQCLESNVTTLVWGPCGSGTSFTLGGDLSGTSTSQMVVGLQGRPLSSAAPGSGQFLEWNGSAWTPATLSGSGTVTTVGLALPTSLFSVSGSPVTTSGMLTGVLANQNANLIFAGPSTGAAAAPSFRALVAADIPALNYQATLSSFSAPANEFLTGFTSPNTFTAAQPSFSNLSGTATLSQLPSSLAQFTGTITAGDCAKWSSSGVLMDAGAACGTSTGGGFTAGGDLSGTSTSQTVIGLQGRAVSSTAPSTGQALEWNGTAWAPATISGGSGAATSLQFGATVQPLSSTAPSSGQVLEWNGTNIVGATVSAFPSESNNTVFAGPATSGNAAPAFRSLVVTDLPTVDIAHGGTGATTAIAGFNALSPITQTGDLIVGDGTNSAVNLHIGADGSTLVANSTVTGGGISWLANYVEIGDGGSTANYDLVKLSGVNGVPTATTDTSGAIGIITFGGGTGGKLFVATGGIPLCNFDGATTAADYVQISSATAGDCHDAGATKPSSGQVIGTVLSTHAAAGQYNVLLNPVTDISGTGGGTSSNATFTITAPVTETTGTGGVALGSGFSIPSSDINSVGTVIEIRAFGLVTTGSSAQTVEYYPTASGTNIGVNYSSTTASVSTSTTNAPWEYKGQCVVESTGASGTMECQGRWYQVTTLNSGSWGWYPSNASSPVTINTTTSLSLVMNVNVTSGGILSGNSISLRQFIVRVVH